MRWLLPAALLTCLAHVGSAQEPASTAGQATEPGLAARVWRDVPYVLGATDRQRLDLYVPEAGVGPLPLLVFVHGGGWTGRSRYPCPVADWTARGYVVASLGYRLAPQAFWPAQIEDVRAPIRWLRAHAAECRVDPNRIAAWGESAGAHLVSLLGVAAHRRDWDRLGPAGDSRVQAVIDWFGRADLLPAVLGPNGERTNPGRLLGGGGPSYTDAARDASPLTYVSRGDAPFLILHGDADTVVPVDLSEVFGSALRKAGVPVTLVVLPGAGHGGPVFRTPELTALTEAFLDRWLAPRQAAVEP